MSFLLDIFTPSKQKPGIPMRRMSEEQDREAAEPLYVYEDEDPLLSEAGLLLEQLRNELEADMVGADAYGSRLVPLIRFCYRELTSFPGQSIVVNRAIQDIGMGRYQWELFILCGFGWFADNLWLQVCDTNPNFSYFQTESLFRQCSFRTTNLS